MAVIAAGGWLSVAVAGHWTGNANLSIGLKYLDEDDWSPLEEHTEVGFSFDMGKTDWPIHIMIELSSSSDDSTETFTGIKVKATTTELALGMRKVWETGGSIRPYIGGGLCLASAELKGSRQGFQSVSDDGSGVGFSVSGGIFWTLGRHFNLGAGLRYSYANAEISNTDVAIGGPHLGLLLGYHW